MARDTNCRSLYGRSVGNSIIISRVRDYRNELGRGNRILIFNNDRARRRPGAPFTGAPARNSEMCGGAPTLIKSRRGSSHRRTNQPVRGFVQLTISAEELYVRLHPESGPSGRYTLLQRVLFNRHKNMGRRARRLISACAGAIGASAARDGLFSYV
ncbi:hypothetical protein EVAR_21118_1 [Eumeta japonica]|uniref:Uncharacterized protein n=1 Tax=Eumeta variegata TaxID=151549 RepID=A0A4C1VW41_EUMVA|nr:hypothetical protein EVAR_21118_1 [Eumeta japonica]